MNRSSAINCHIRYFARNRLPSAFFVLLLCLLLAVDLAHALPAREWRKVLDLGGQWKFMIGDNPEWKAPGADDFLWDYIQVPGSWEDQGFNGYDGFAWYRKSFKLPQNAGRNLYLHLGYIDDVDEVYINGHLAGFSGSLPPAYYTAFHAYRRYRIPLEYLNANGENVIAVRVYDHQIEGGIVHGEAGIFTPAGDLTALDLQGVWKFRHGDHPDWKNPALDDAGWENMMVPAAWENQGYRHYDGFAWYRLSFLVPASLNAEYYLLLLGRIDDFDQTWLNGQLIGVTNDRQPFGRSFSYRQPRVYSVPAALLKKGEINTVAIRVQDVGHVGGLYEGPVALVSRRQYFSDMRNR